ncbi:hypothetical protein CBW65_03695 [Tumebacillus avium]|uniref:Thioredoxin domain-containing protein n=1 Tax=Tumebacillus avium TaxID=1903704 RepID=A0A1Y0IL89_9BACL|nr:hypothetical protein [Tumebacillus avium]ARU60265.1 hypothetical protein CBW65_03695 [Tumebacillus avium]
METFLLISNLVSWIFIFILLFAVYRLAKMVNEFLHRFRITGDRVEKDALQTGQPAPLMPVEEESGRPMLLVFAKDDCKVCQTLISYLPEFQPKFPELRVLVIAPALAAGQPGKAVPDGVTLLRNSRMIQEYRIKEYPYFVLISAQGVIAEHGIVASYETMELNIRRFL